MQSGKKWYTNRVIWVVTLAVFSACALLIIQGVWLKKTFENERQRLESDLNRALPEFLFFRPELDLLGSAGNLPLQEQSRVALEKQIEHSITTSLQSNDISTEFSYALLNGSRDSILFSSSEEHHEALLLSKYQKCVNCQEIKYLPADSTLSSGATYLVSVTDAPNDRAGETAKTEQIFLSLYFPDFDQIMFNNLLKQLALVIVFVVLLVLCFFYILRIVFRQKKVSEIKNDFINNLTHELKTPLASMSLATTVLQESLAPYLSDRNHHHFALIRNEQLSLENQIDKVLQMAMADAGNFELETELTDISQLVANTLTNLELLIAQSEGSIELKRPGHEIFIEVDVTHLSNVIYNLVDNALKYCDTAPEILIEIKVLGDRLTISVEDNGIGIPADTQQAIFDKFYRAQQPTAHGSPGFGLGLSYVKRIINLHKGEVSLQSQPGAGSIFILSLPMQKGHV